MLWKLARCGSIFVCLFVAGSALFLSIGCSRASETDLERLNLINEIYGERFVLEFEGEFHLDARLKQDVQVDESELISIYKVFAFDDSMKEKRDTTYMFLSFYDHRGRLQYQVYYDKIAKKFRKSLPQND
jgi:hypothetical protein